MFANVDWTTGGLTWKPVDSQLFKKAESNSINKQYNPKPSKLTLRQKILKVKEVGEEIIQEEQIERLFTNKKFPICYDGFEPSGRMHIAQGLLRALNVNRLVDCGCIFIFWVADWFALLNNKMGGDLEKIQTVGKYFIEVWKSVGMKMHNVKFLWASEEINNNSNEYWLRVLDIARKNTVSRIKRCGQIMGRTEESDEMPVAQLIYPCMQCTDVFFLETDICSLGLDQRKVNMLAREYCSSNAEKPMIVSHHMLYGLKEGQAKMSKSDPDSAIFMEDSAKDVERKIKQSFCPEGIIEENPILDYIKQIIFGWRDSIKIQRKADFGGDITYTSYQQLEQDFKEKKLHPGDLKPAVAKILNELIQPVRDHFEKNMEAKLLLQKVRSYQVTR